MKKVSGNATNVYVGRRIKIRRQSLGYTLDNIAIKTGISSQMCSKYERGVVQIPPYSLLRLSLALSISVDLLFPENPNLLVTDNQNTAANNLGIPKSALALDFDTDLYYRKETVDLVEAFNLLPTPELRKVIHAMVRTVASELPRAEASLAAE